MTLKKSKKIGSDHFYCCDYSYFNGNAVTAGKKDAKL